MSLREWLDLGATLRAAQARLDLRTVADMGARRARVEGRVSIERILDRLLDITIDEDKHGPADNRTYTYEPTFILRGLTELNIKFKGA